MGNRSDAEWGEPYDDAEPPRRDRVPEPGFTRPSDVNSDWEITYFVPEFRAKRVRIARLVTVGIALFLVTILTRLVVWGVRADADELSEGMVPYIFATGCGVVGVAVVYVTWRWALERDRRDLRRRP